MCLHAIHLSEDTANKIDILSSVFFSTNLGFILLLEEGFCEITLCTQDIKLAASKYTLSLVKNFCVKKQKTPSYFN